jgi:excinuclease ABC subunit A
VQKKFASSPSAIASVLTISDFSLTGGEGRCQLCQGTGYQETNLDYLGSSRQKCPECHGNRYREIILQCQLKGKNINDFFAMSVEEISEHFPGEKIAKCLEKVITMGLGYLLFGQPFSSLSGGEKQRVALAEILAQPDITDSLILLDEPGAGLHGSDLTILKNCFDQLIARKNTIVLVEHRFPLLAQMDHLIELGPDGGKGGGQILFCGSPMQLATNPTATGKALKKWSNTRL